MAVNRIWEGGMKIVPESRFVGEGCPINHPECGYEAIKLDFQYETSQKFHEPGRYSTSYQEEPAPQYQGFSEPPRFQQTSIVDNSILGSGNFEILKGGTFYDKNDYRQYRSVENVGVKSATNFTFASFFSATTHGLRVMGMDRTTSSTTSETLPTSRRRTRGRVADITATTS